MTFITHVGVIQPFFGTFSLATTVTTTTSTRVTNIINGHFKLEYLSISIRQSRSRVVSK